MFYYHLAIQLFWVVGEFHGVYVIDTVVMKHTDLVFFVYVVIIGQNLYTL